jgi:hypothetical protein
LSEQLAISVALKQLYQAVDIAEDPKIIDLALHEREECRPWPFDPLARWLKTEKLTPMHTRKAHARKGPRFFNDEIKNVAPKSFDRPMHKVDV